MNWEPLINNSDLNKHIYLNITRNVIHMIQLVNTMHSFSASSEPEVTRVV